MPPLLRLRPPLRASLQSFPSPSQRHFYTSPSLTGDVPPHHPVTTLSRTHLHALPNRPHLSLLITTPPDATSDTSTILSLSSTLPPPSSSITITPQYPSTATFPTLLHDITISLQTTRSLFPTSRTGLLASSYLGSLALSTALTQGRANVTAVAAHEPVVDLFAQGKVSYDHFFRKWVSADGTGERERLFGQDPGLYWADPFASPLFWFVTAGVVFPQQGDRWDERLQPLRTELRKARMFPPPGFIPGVGWGVAEGDRRLPRMLVSLGGDGEQTKARAVFIDEAGSAVDVAREGADMGQWLERVLTGKEVEEFVHPEQKRELLQRMMAGGRQRVSGEMEEDSLPGGETVDTEINIESLRKKVLLMKMQKARAMAAEAKKTLVVPRKPVVGVVGAMKAVSTSFGVKTAKKEFLKKPVVAVKTALLTKTVPPATPPTMAKTTSMPFGTKKEWQTNPSVVVKTAPPTTPTPATSISSGANKEWQNKPPATFKTYPPAKPHTAAKAAPTYYGKKRGWPKKPAVTVSTALPTTPTPTTSFSAIKEPPEKPAVTVNTTQPAAQNPWIKMDAKSKSPSTSFKSKSSFMGFKQKASTSRGRSG